MFEVVEINVLFKEIHNDALQMRDSTKIVLHKQEHTASASTKMRERQAFDLRRQVDERKIELERLERKLFSTGTAGTIFIFYFFKSIIVINDLKIQVNK